MESTLSSPGVETGHPALDAERRVVRASLALGLLGLAVAAFVIVRLLERWRIGTSAGGHVLSIAGLRSSYPAANAGALVILALATAGLAVVSIAIGSAVRELTRSWRMTRRLRAVSQGTIGGAVVLPDEVPRAFCAGLVRTQIYISSGAVRRLDPAALNAVLAHERHHVARRDPARLATARVLARALYFLPVLRALARRHELLAELNADASAVGTAPHARAALARAMLVFEESGAAAGAGIGIDLARVDHLLGESPAWRFPAALCAAGVAIVLLIGALAVLAGRVAAGSATLAPPFLSRQPCIVILALIPVGLGLLGGHLVLRHRAQSR